MKLVFLNTAQKLTFWLKYFYLVSNPFINLQGISNGKKQLSLKKCAFIFKYQYVSMVHYLFNAGFISVNIMSYTALKGKFKRP